ncbi:MAG: hypothetical protein M1608_06815 [Candidatus Omnitrophica bacterium]|nr:hypothetical protein [Candidatus Omnitrophota bacterium]
MKTAAQPPSSAQASFPSGCFTVDPCGEIIASTLPHTFPSAHVRRIAEQVLQTFRAAQEAQLLLNELQIHYPALKLTARNLRGGAIIFVAPHSQA